MGKATAKKRGRPSAYKDEYAEMARKLCSIYGSIDTQLADFFGVTEKTINTWKKNYPDFLQSLKEAKPEADDQVVKALFKRAIGCNIPDSDIRVIEGKIVVTPLQKHFPPETAACMAWLYNRQPDKWKQRKVADESETPERLAEAIATLAPKLPN